MGPSPRTTFCQPDKLLLLPSTTICIELVPGTACRPFEHRFSRLPAPRTARVLAVRPTSYPVWPADHRVSLLASLCLASRQGIVLSNQGTPFPPALTTALHRIELRTTNEHCPTNALPTLPTTATPEAFLISTPFLRPRASSLVPCSACRNRNSSPCLHGYVNRASVSSNTSGKRFKISTTPTSVTSTVNIA